MSAPDLADHLDRLERDLNIGPGTNGFEGSATTADSMWAVTDFTQENDAARLIPGTHRADSSPVYGQHSMNYCAGCVRQQENQQLGIPLDTVRRFSPALQELCGFGTYRGLIGHIDKQTARQRVLGVDDPTGMLWDRT